MKRAENEDLDKAVFTLFHNTRANNVPVSGVVMKRRPCNLQNPCTWMISEPLMVGSISGNLGSMSF